MLSNSPSFFIGNKNKVCVVSRFFSSSPGRNYGQLTQQRMRSAQPQKAAVSCRCCPNRRSEVISDKLQRPPVYRRSDGTIQNSPTFRSFNLLYLRYYFIYETGDNTQQFMNQNTAMNAQGVEFSPMLLEPN